MVSTNSEVINTDGKCTLETRYSQSPYDKAKAELDNSTVGRGEADIPDLVL